MASPVWYGKSEKQFEPLIKLCHKHSVPFYKYSNDTCFVRHDEMFKDGSHLNAIGADEFTKQFLIKLYGEE